MAACRHAEGQIQMTRPEGHPLMDELTIDWQKMKPSAHAVSEHILILTTSDDCFLILQLHFLTRIQRLRICSAQASTLDVRMRFVFSLKHNAMGHPPNTKPLLHSPMHIRGKSHCSRYHYSSGAQMDLIMLRMFLAGDHGYVTLRGLVLMFMLCINSGCWHSV